MKRTLGGVKIGDKIKAERPYERGSWEILTVDRVTKTQAVCGTAAFRIDSGLKIGTGDSWSRIYGQLVNESEIAALEAALALKSRINRARKAVQGISISAENIEAAEAFIAASQPKEPSK